jgi:hypothetical protein
VNLIVSISKLEDEDVCCLVPSYASNEEVLYTVGTLKAWVMFGRNSKPVKAQALLDGGSEINLLHRSVADYYYSYYRLPIMLHCGEAMRSAKCGRPGFVKEEDRLGICLG